MTKINLDKKEDKSLYEEKSIHIDENYINKKMVYTPQLKQSDFWKPILRLFLTLLFVSVIIYMTFWSTSVLFEKPIEQPITTISELYNDYIKQINFIFVVFYIFAGSMFIYPFILLFSCNSNNKNINEDND